MKCKTQMQKEQLLSYRRLALFLLLFFTICQLQSQTKYSTTNKKAEKLFDNAVEAYDRMLDDQAIKYLDAAIKLDPKFIEAYLLKAEVFHGKKDYETEVELYNKVTEIDPDFSGKVYGLAGSTYLKLGKYADAKDNFDKCLTFESLNLKYKQTIKANLNQAEFGIHALANPVVFRPINMGDNINSILNEYWPSLTADEQTMIITVLVPRPGISPDAPANDKTFQEDLYVSYLEDGKWSKVFNIGPEINTSQYNEGTQAFSVDGLHLFYTVCNKPGDHGRCDLYYSRNIDKKWTLPENIGPPISTAAWESHPTFSSDGRTLYFVSNRKGGLGEMDIWTSTLNDDGTWSQPVNLGDSINTPGYEMSPFIHPDNQTIYFASDGHTGMGGLDIYYSRRDTAGKWGKPINMGYPINTYHDEKGMIVNAKGDLAYFATNRLGDKRDDIYKFELYPDARPVLVTYVKGKVYNAETMEGIEANFELTDLETDQIVVQSESDETSGKYLVCLPTERNYAFNIFKKGFMFHSENFSLKNLEDSSKPFELDIAMQPIAGTKRVILKNIFFDTDSFTLRPESRVELNKLVAFLEENSGLVIEIGGHTDNEGSLEHNQELSENRAKTVYEYLINSSINASRLSYKGYDYSVPIDTNDTEEGRAKNRRTEFTIIRTDFDD